MIFSLMLLAAAAGTPAWLDQAFQGRPGSKWQATVTIDRPGPGDDRDTGKACRDGTSERLDFKHGTHFMAGDSAVFLENPTKTAWVGPRRRFPAHPDAQLEILRSEKLLGRNVAVVEIRGTHGHGRRLWIDTLLPLVLRSEALQPGHGGPERQFLTLQTGIPCPAGSFQVPPGWTVKHGPPPSGPDGRPDAKHRRHPAESEKALIEAVGFVPPQPPWLPAGFAASNWAWVDTREGKAAQIFYDNGQQKLSIFFRPATERPPVCPTEGCKDREGRSVYFGRVGGYGIAVTGNLPPEQMEKVAGIRK